MVPTLFRTYLQANRSNNIIALSLCDCHWALNGIVVDEVERRGRRRHIIQVYDDDLQI